MVIVSTNSNWYAAFSSNPISYKSCKAVLYNVNTTTPYVGYNFNNDPNFIITIAKNGTGDYTITLPTNYLSSAFVVEATAVGTSPLLCVVNSFNGTVSFDLNVYTVGTVTVLSDPSYIYLSISGN